MAHHSSEARRVRRELDKELAATAAATGRNLVWSAADHQVLELISAAIGRKVDLSQDYAATQEPKTRVKLSAEIRLIESTYRAAVETGPHRRGRADEHHINEGTARGLRPLGPRRRCRLRCPAGSTSFLGCTSICARR